MCHGFQDKETGIWPIALGETRIFHGSLYRELGSDQVSPSESGMFHGFPYRELEFGQSHRVRLRCVIAFYIANWDLAGLARQDSGFSCFSI